MSNTTYFTGCSFTKGDEIASPRDTWASILHEKSVMRDTSMCNLGVNGNNNAQIFQESLLAAANVNCKYLVVAWTALYRDRIYPGVENYTTEVFWGRSSPMQNVAVSPGVIVTANYLRKLRDQYISVNHIHYEFIKVLKYTNTIQEVCNRLGVIVFFINAMISEWDDGFFDRVNTQTKSMLNFDDRTDLDFGNLVEKINNDYANSNGLNANWINISNSFSGNFMIDKGTDDMHPGIKSHQKFADFLLKAIQ